VIIIPLTHKAVILILPSRKRKFLSEADNTHLQLFIGEIKLMYPEEPMTGSVSRKPRLVGRITGYDTIKLFFSGKPRPVGGELH
jgi:hypothetical protein